MPQIPDKNLKAMDMGATKGQVQIFDFVSVILAYLFGINLSAVLFFQAGIHCCMFGFTWYSIV